MFYNVPNYCPTYLDELHNYTITQSPAVLLLLFEVKYLCMCQNLSEEDDIESFVFGELPCAFKLLSCAVNRTLHII